LGLTPIFGILDKLGLPKQLPMDDDGAPKLDVAKLSGLAQRLLGLNLFVNFDISEDVQNTTRNKMMVSERNYVHFH
jgi:hypothetical protein